MEVLTVTLNPAIDRLVRLPRDTRAGQVADHRVPTGECHAGGKGVNVARALCALGRPARSVGFSGGLAGQMFERLLAQEKIAHHFIAVTGETRTNTTVISGKGRVERFIEPGPAVTDAPLREMMRFLRTTAPRVRAVVFSGSLPPGVSAAAFRDLVGVALAAGVRVAVDTSGPALEKCLSAEVDVIKPNRAETEEVLGVTLNSSAKISKALRLLHGCGIKKVLISLGEDGLAGYNGREEVLATLPAVRGAPAVGCGDAALAGFLAAQFSGRPFRECVGFAAACGGAGARARVPGGIELRRVSTLFTKVHYQEPLCPS